MASKESIQALGKAGLEGAAPLGEAGLKGVMASGLLWVEEGEQRLGIVAEVAPIIPVTKTYAYAIPDELAEKVAIGHRVQVSVGRRGRLTPGFVVALDRRIWDSTLRPIDLLIDDRSYLSPELVALARTISRHYCCPLGRTLKAITPAPVRQGRGLKKVRYLRLSDSIDALVAGSKRLTAGRKAVVNRLSGSREAVAFDDLSIQAEVSAAVLRKMIAEGWLTAEVREEIAGKAGLKGAATPAPAEKNAAAAEPDFLLNTPQQEAIDAIRATVAENVFRVLLLYGVSGSGKTEVYIHAMRNVLASGRQAVLMVPEIVLTTQLVNRIAARLPNVAVMHSGLPDAQRSVMWRQIASGQRTVVIGTRSAIFAPCPKLGLIIVDEEQEPSFKNLQAPRFNVRDVAIMRAQELCIPVVLGSATPSLETWYRSDHRSDYRRLVLPGRVRDLPMPTVHVVDMDVEQAEVKRTVLLSRIMETGLRDTLDRGEQALLLINRRGFATRLVCPDCRARITCPNCNVNLVVHTAGAFTICHYCRMRVPIPERCPVVTCGAKLVQYGLGTQRIESVLSELFNSASIRRVDSDTMRKRSDYEQVVADLEARKIDILVGTQMIAKGLDFPFVSFVGVFEADAAAFAGDFRAHERLFQLITQVAGRAGRSDAPGKVVVQTGNPHELPALRHALTHDYETFAAEELRVRERIGWPPFRRIARLVLSHPREQTARESSEETYAAISETMKALALEQADILGPASCTVSRIRGRYRYELIVRTRSANDLTRLLERLDQLRALRPKSASLILDVDPVSMS